MIVPGPGRHLLADLYRWGGGRLWILFALMVVAGLSEVVGILLLVPLVAVADGSVDWSAAIGIADPLDGLSVPQRVLTVVAAFVAAMGLRALLSLASEKRQSSLALGYEHSLRARLLGGLVERGWSRGSRMGESSLQTLLIVESSRASYSAQQALTIVTAGALLAIQGLAAFMLSPRLTLVAIAAVGLLVLVGVPAARASHRKGAEIGEAHERAGEDSGALIQGLKTASAEGRVGDYLATWRASDRRLFDEQHVLAMQAARVRTGLGFLLAVLAAVLLLVGRMAFDLPLVVLIPLLVLMARLAGPARQMLNAYQSMLAYAPAFDRLSPHLADAIREEDSGSAAEPYRWRRIEAVGLAHRACETFGLGPLDFTLSAGEWVGLSGPSGSGKTSLIDSLAGLLRPDAGVVTVDDVPVDLAADPRWAAQLSYVGQNEALYGGSLREVLGLAGSTCEDSERSQILEATGVSEISARLAEGLDTPLGHRATLLSGGEIARVAIARALLRRPSLLVLDEATAALDLESEGRLLDGIRTLPRSPAVLMVAHRPQSLAHMDRVVSMDAGKFPLKV